MQPSAKSADNPNSRAPALSKASPLYIQYGCGQSCPDGWINFDASPTLRLQRLPVIGRLFRSNGATFPKDVRFGDIVKGLPVADGSASGVYASHVLEHLSHDEFRRALDHTFTMLRPTGIFRLVVPDLKSRAQTYLQRVEQGDAKANDWFMHSSHLGLERRPRGLQALARTIFGRSSHLWMWDEDSIAAALTEAGFSAIRRCHIGDCKDPAFLAVEDASRFYDPALDIEECAMEAIKPASRPADRPLAENKK